MDNWKVFGVVLGAALFALAHAREDDAQIRRFVQIIQDGQQHALNYQLPTDARRYQSGYANCFWNPLRCFTRRDMGTFDFIVVGSGAAGSAIANRLTEVAAFSVLLLEAGEVENDFVDVPAMAFYTMGTDYNWAYTSVPQSDACLGMVERRCQFQRGRGVGGTTLINGLVYSRGSADDYDRWARDTPGWSYADVLPYFKKSERTAADGLDRGYHGRDGYVNVEYANYTNVHIDAFLRAHEETGYPLIDYNGRDHLGASRCQLNSVNGRRQTAGAAYIQPILNRKNLVVSTGSYVTRVRISPFTHLARGVEFNKGGAAWYAHARREVILSAGAIGSPHILLLSGVGPADHLSALGIRPLVDLPVGANLQDHIVVFGSAIVTNTSIPLQPIEGYVADYLAGKGAYTLPGNNAALAFHKTNFSKHASADLELLMTSANRTDAYFQKGYAFTDATAAAILEDIDEPATFNIYIYALHPDSVGTVRLQSANPFDYPLIDPRFLDNRYDLDTLYYGVLLVQRLLETEAFRKLDARFKPIRLPNCARFEMFSREYWHCFIRQTSDEIYHPVGTCKMGTRPAEGAVVDGRLRVHGVRNLRVADASVIPFSMVGHTSAPATMVGERCADFVKEDHDAGGKTA